MVITWYLRLNDLDSTELIASQLWRSNVKYQDAWTCKGHHVCVIPYRKSRRQKKTVPFKGTLIPFMNVGIFKVWAYDAGTIWIILTWFWVGIITQTVPEIYFSLLSSLPPSLFLSLLSFLFYSFLSSCLSFYLKGRFTKREGEMEQERGILLIVNFLNFCNGRVEQTWS